MSTEELKSKQKELEELEAQKKFSILSEDNSDFDETHKSKEFIRNYYGFIALAAGLLNGLQNFLFEVIVYTQVDSSTLTLYFAEFTGYLGFAVAYHLYEAIQQKRRYGTFWSKERSSYILSNESQPLKDYENMRIDPSGEINETRQWKFNTFNIKAVLVRFSVSLAASLTRMLVMWTESLANMNFSLVANLMSLGPFIVAVSFYFIFKEGLNYLYIVGIVMLVSCAILTSLASSSSSDTDDYTISPIIPIMLAILQTFLGAAISIVTRYIVTHSKLTVQQMVSDNFFMQGLVYMCFHFGFSFPYPAGIFWTIGAISIVGFVALLLLNIAVAFGKAAPSMALNDSSTIFTLLLEIMILSKVPSTLQLIAFFIGLGGGALIAFESRTKKEVEELEQNNNNNDELIDKNK